MSDATDVDTIRAWLAAASFASLATLGEDGAPFASVVPFALDVTGTKPVMWLSDLAVHTKNMRGDPRCSLLVVDPATQAAGGDPQTSWRVTLVGRALVHDDVADPQTRDGYFVKHPHSARLPGFNLWRIDVESARFIAGFGRMGFVDWPGA